MPTTPSYTDVTLSEFMVAALGEVGRDLEAGYDEMLPAVERTLDVYGETDIANATEMPKLRALARAAAWEWAVDQYVTLYGTAMDGQTQQRQQLFQQAEKRSAYWTNQAGRYGGGGSVVQTMPVVRRQNPYGPREAIPSSYP